MGYIRNLVWVLFFMVISLSGCQTTEALVLAPPTPDLVIYTSGEEDIYTPIIKEFSERTGMSIQTKRYEPEPLMALLQDETYENDCDILFGVSTQTLEQHKDLLHPYESPDSQFISQRFRSADFSFTTFSALPLVIMYNTNVVTYRELPTGFLSLLEPRWNGRIAFADPGISEAYASALITAVRACPSIPDYLERFAENLDYQTLDQLSDVNQGIAAGRYSLGVTLEESAQMLRSQGADIDYVYPSEGTIAILDGTAMLKGCPHPDAARDFIDFTISKDTQRILTTALNRRTVREDIPPHAGLSPLRNLPLVESDLTTMPEEQARILERWNDLFADHKTAEGKVAP